MASWMIDEKDPARLEIVDRAKSLGIEGSPAEASNFLGEITLANGKTVNAFVVHAVDAIITDGNEIVMINRLHDPGCGKPALPGGLIDPTAGGVESSIAAAAREAMEEAGINLDQSQAMLIGKRNFDRPFDVRVAQNNGLAKQYGIKEGDIFMISTQAVRFQVPNLASTALIAGDDAIPGSARRVQVDTLARETLGIADHFDMVQTAFPEKVLGAVQKVAAINNSANMNVAVTQKPSGYKVSSAG